MIKNLFFLLILVCLKQASAQDVSGTLNVKVDKESVSVVLDYGSGFHTIFYNDSKLQYNRINYGYNIESQGSIPLELGYKAKILEVNANRKFINVFYDKIDSVGLRLLQINTINGKSKKKVIAKSWSQKGTILSHFSINDTAHFLLNTVKSNVQYISIAYGDIIDNIEFQIDESLITAWTKKLKEAPQLSKSLVHNGQLSFYNKLHLGPIKSYFNHRYTSFTLDLGFNTELVRINRKLKSLTHNKVLILLHINGGLSGAIAGSYLRGRYLFQTALLQQGCIIQKNDLKFDKVVYNQFVNYNFSANSGSPVYFLNRGEKGSFENDNVKGFKLHEDRLNKLIAINITKKGPFDHFMVSEVEPIDIHDNWLEKSSNISPSVARRTKKAITTHFAIDGQTPMHFSLLQHVQCMSSTFCFSLNGQGELSPYLGSDDFKLAKAVEYYDQSIRKGIPPYHATLTVINDKPHYCFYKRRQKLFYFIPL